MNIAASLLGITAVAMLLLTAANYNNDAIAKIHKPATRTYTTPYVDKNSDGYKYCNEWLDELVATQRYSTLQLINKQAACYSTMGATY